MIQVERVRKVYGDGALQHVALHGVDLEVASGSMSEAESPLTTWNGPPCAAGSAVPMSDTGR